MPDLGLQKPGSWNAQAARKRCLAFRRRILDVSQKVQALHIAPAFSCLEIVDCIYNGLLSRDGNGEYADMFLMSKGHGCLAQYVVLENLSILTGDDLDAYCTPQGRLGSHPDYGVPGILASTGSLGHGVPMALGMAYAEKILGSGRSVYALMGDGEMHEGSVWEAFMMASSLGVENMIVILDLNDFQGLGRISEIHPGFYPIAEKLQAFGWETATINGHDSQALFETVNGRRGGKPLFVVANTVKGKGVSYMENVPIWHYRSPSPEEYEEAIANLHEVSK